MSNKNPFEGYVPEGTIVEDKQIAPEAPKDQVEKVLRELSPKKNNFSNIPKLELDEKSLKPLEAVLNQTKTVESKKEEKIKV